MENTPLIYKSIIEVMKETDAIAKNRKNQQQGFQYRGIDDVMNELHDTLAKCGVFVVPNVLSEERTVGKSRNGSDLFYTRQKICFTFYAADGSHIDSIVVGEAMDSGDKGSNKALSIGLKYALMQVFCIPTEDDKDPDAVTHEPAPNTIKAGKNATPAAAKAAAKAFEGTIYKGGETTPAEKKEIAELLKATYPDGTRVFTTAEAKSYSAQRAVLTAREVIDKIREDLNARCPQKTAGDMLREQEAAAQAPATESEAIF